MSLSQLWKSSREQLLDKHINQVIGFSGAGKLADGSVTSNEFRELLSLVPSELLCRYVDDCLSSSFQDSGMALQDVVNQIGRRLGFQVEDGRYRGQKGNIGHDGLWRFPNGHSVVVEVKTTDAYRVDTGAVAAYRRKLIAKGDVVEESSSILYVVGREDTGDLEAQIRGSKHAWDIRLLSVDALIRLMKLKESVNDQLIINRICAILIPREFTRLDEIIDVVFFAAEEAKFAAPQDPEAPPEEEISRDENHPRSKPVAFHDDCIRVFELQRDVVLVKQSRSNWLSHDKSIAIVCAVSKTHSSQGHPTYWFAFHPSQREFLSGANSGFLILGCGSVDKVLAVPFVEFEKWLPYLWMTEREDRTYWHIRLSDNEGVLFLERRKGSGALNVTEFLLSSSSVS